MMEPGPPPLVLSRLFPLDQYQSAQWLLNPFPTYRYIREGLSIALTDLYSKLNKLTLSDIFGVARVLCEKPVMPVLHVNSTSITVHNARIWREQGVKYTKLKLSGDLDHDVCVLQELEAQSLLPHLVDANYGYSRNLPALRIISSLISALSIPFFQNPSRSYKECRQILTSHSFKIPADSTAYIPQLRRVIRSSAANALNLHPNCIGGFDSAFKSIMLASSLQFPIFVGSSGYLGIQDRAFQKLSFYIYSKQPCENIGFPSYFRTPDLKHYLCDQNLQGLTNYLPHHGGFISDDSDFLGIEVDTSRLKHIAIRQP
jgi:L-alanine-DL-glutamate epimerase-like enolase superfamily enzyme